MRILARCFWAMGLARQDSFPGQGPSAEEEAKITERKDRKIGVFWDANTHEDVERAVFVEIRMRASGRICVAGSEKVGGPSKCCLTSFRKG